MFCGLTALHLDEPFLKPVDAMQNFAQVGRIGKRRARLGH
jgi:hypothetical protein